MKRISLLSTYTLFFITFLSANLFAEIKLPAIFGDNMVLQRETQVAIWGEASKNSSVRVTTSWNGKSYYTESSNNGSWKLKVATLKAGGPYEITISDGTALKLKNVLIGEVWVCSGQSNMEMQMKGRGMNQPVLGSTDAIALSSNPNIRLFTVRRGANIKPLNDFTGDWKTCEPESVSEFSATAYYFGLMLQKVLNVPVGLINSSWGGTSIQPWISKTTCKKFDFIKLGDKIFDGNQAQQTPTALFNAMINPMVGYGIRGVIWYQGEGNINEPQNYQKMLPGLIEDWRSLWGIGDFPFYYMQIAPFDYGQEGLNSAYLREAQLKASTTLPNIGMACILDIGEKNCIHPSNKETGSKRLALMALEQTYGIKGINGLSPVMKEMSVSEGVVKLIFDNAPNGLTSFGKELSCFEVAGADKRFFPAKAFITRAGVTLFSPSVSEPVAVRYAFKDFVVGDLFGVNGFPVSSFRTDEWVPEK
jgi:sialate O-acetylesterase